MQYPILQNSNVYQEYFKLVLDISKPPCSPIPGQFYNIRCGRTNDPLLRRPFSIHSLTSENGALHLEFLYRVIGKGTKWLSKCRPGQELDVIGPLGNGFIIPNNLEHVLLVARGTGIAPLYSIGQWALNNNISTKVFIIFGTRTGERLFYLDECRRLGQLFVYTDDGSQGFYGRAPELMEQLILNGTIAKETIFYACGPKHMLQELNKISERFGMAGQVTLEDNMACGFGVCLSCVCPLKPEHIIRNVSWPKPALQKSEDTNLVYSLLCKDGPVYDIQEVDWNDWLS